MRLWSKVRRGRICVIVVAVALGLLVMLGDLTVSMPALTAFRGVTLPISLLAPLSLPISLAWGLANGDPAAESVASRLLAWYDTALAVGMAAAFAAAAVGLQRVGLTELGVAAARNVFGYVGMMLMGRWLFGRESAAVLPVGFVVVAAAFAGDTIEDAAWWAWFVRPVQDPASWNQAVAWFGLGVVASLRGRVGLAAVI